MRPSHDCERSAMVEVTRRTVRDVLIKALANVEGVDETEISEAIDQLGGDQMYELDSKTAEAILAEVGEALGLVVAGPADLPPEQYATLDALLNLLETALGVVGRS